MSGQKVSKSYVPATIIRAKFASASYPVDQLWSSRLCSCFPVWNLTYIYDNAGALNLQSANNSEETICQVRLVQLKKQKKKTQETTPQAAWQLSPDNIASGSGWWHQRNQSLPIPKKPCQRTARKSNPEPEGIYITLWISLATIIKYQIPLPISEMLMASRRVEIPRSAGLGILSPAAYFRRVSLAPSKSPRPSHGLWAMDASHGCQPWSVDPTTAHPLVVLMSAFIHLNCHFIYIYRCICSMLVCVILIHTINWYNGWAEALSVFPTSDRMQCSNSISVMAWCCSFS